MRPLTTLKDDELIFLFSQGSQQVFDILVSRHQQRLFLTVQFIIKDRHYSEDILQEIYIKIFKSVQEGRYHEEGKFLSWALRIARNYCFDYKKQTRGAIIKYQDNIKDGQPYEECSESLLIRKENQNKLRSLLKYLPQDQRKVLICRYYLGMSFKQIATHSNCSINTALGRMRYALINLRKLLQNISACQNAS
jgi:RNA polymerase sigma factor (sigma-70 family)